MRPEERYEDVQSCLFRGFLTAQGKLGDIPVVFKSINHLEYRRIAHYGTDTKTQNVALVALSLYLFDYQNVLSERERHLPKIMRELMKVPSSVLTAVSSVLSDLNNRAAEALPWVEGFSYEPLSRHFWRAHQRTALCSPEVTGIPGTEMLGLNVCQQLWVSLNNLEDQRELQEFHWDNAKFIASATNPKGIKSIDNADKARKKREEERREAVRKRGKSEDSGMVRITAESVEDLTEQYRKTMAGEQDFHDKIIAEHEEKARQQWLKQQQESRESLERIKEQRELYKIPEGPRRAYLVDANDEIAQWKDRQVRSLSGNIQKAGRNADIRSDEDQDRLARKWGLRGDFEASELLAENYQTIEPDAAHPDAHDLPPIYDPIGAVLPPEMQAAHRKALREALNKDED